VTGRPRFLFWITLIDFAIINGYHKNKPGGSVNFPPPIAFARYAERHSIGKFSPDTNDPDTAGRETIMLTRRGFAAFASCALCGLAEFAATEASAEGTPPPAPTGFTRKILSQMDGPVPGYVTLVVEVSIDPGTFVARHTHPGIESGYVVAGGFDLPIQGQETRKLKPGDGFQIPVETPHAGTKNGDTKALIVSTYVVEKGKPLASPAPS
jgi:quercetin dioxygenase-like cupin family protein